MVTVIKPDGGLVAQTEGAWVSIDLITPQIRLNTAI